MEKRPRFESVKIPLVNGEELHGLFSRPYSEPIRIVFIPPLIGSTAELQATTFRYFAQRATQIFSFEYRGHNRSSGDFSLENSVQDTRDALLWVRQYAEKEGFPLHTVSTCYGTITLLSNFKSNENHFNIRSINTVSGLFSMDYVINPEEFASILSIGIEGEKPTRESLADMVRNGTINLTDTRVLAAFRRYLKQLFPELDIGDNHFAQLRYERAARKATILQFLVNKFFNSNEVIIPEGVPCNFFYGKDDRVIGLGDSATRKRYLLDASRIDPHARFYEVEINHFGRGNDTTKVAESLCDIFDTIDRVNTKRQ